MEFIKPSEQFDLKGFYLEITSKCNLRCLHCYNESGILKNEISFELFKRLIDEFDEKPDITFSGGEPLLHPDIWKMLEYAQDKINNDSVLITPVYNFINDRLVDESAVLRPLSWHLILYVFRYFSRKWQKISDCECPDLIQNETPVRFLYGTQKNVRSDRAESSWHSN